MLKFFSFHFFLIDPRADDSPNLMALSKDTYLMKFFTKILNQ